MSQNNNLYPDISNQGLLNNQAPPPRPNNPYNHPQVGPYNQPYINQGYVPPNQVFPPGPQFNQGFIPNNQGFIPNNQGFIPGRGMICPFCRR